MMETTILLKPEDQWRTIHLDRWYSGWAPSWIKPTLRRVWPEEGPITWEGLRDRLDQRLQLPGVTNAWTMPIKARIDMLTTGIRTPVGIKIFGPDLDRIQSIGQQVEAVIRDVPGTRSVYAERTTGGYYVDIIPRREQAARYGLSVAQVEDIVESAIGGTPISTTIEGPERFTINVRYARELRDDLDRLSHVLVPIPAAGGAADGAAQAAGPGGGAMGASSAGAGSGMGGAMGAGVSGSAGSPTSSIAPSGIPEWSRGFDTPRMGAAVPLGQIADIVVSTGPPMIKDEAASLTGWVYIDVVDRDIGRYVEDAKKAVAKIPLPAGYYLSWTGQYELLEVMRQRMKIVIPITLLIIVVMLYLNSKSVASTIIVLLSVPFAVTGSIWMLYLHNLLRPQDPWNLSVAVAVGMIALAGLAAETGVVMIVYLDEAYHRYKAEGRMNTQHDLFHAITEGAVQRVRPKLMTVMCILMGLVPLMWAHGAGADVMRRIAAPMIGGVITSSILTLEIVPAIYSLWRGRSVTWVKDGREGASAGSEQAK
jgi:Cu(I)/Ag(I) efflux system membrane protein CusA/SilA